MDVALGKRDGVGREIGVEDKPPLTRSPNDAQSLLTDHDRVAAVPNGRQQGLDKVATDLQELAVVGKMRGVDPAPVELGCEESLLRARIRDFRHPFWIGKLRET